MTAAPAVLLLQRRTGRVSAPRRARPSPPTAWTSERAEPVEIVVNDQSCISTLLEYAAPLFPAEVVSGSGWIVRLQPPPTGVGWVLELLSLVERWLESARLPCAKVRYGGRSYLIRASTDIAQLRTATESRQRLSQLP